MKVFNFILGAFLVFMVLTFMRCNEVTEITELTKHTEKIQIIFYNGEDEDTFIDITDASEISDFNKYFDNSDLPVINCTMTGRIVFYMEPEVSAGAKNSVNMEFSLSDDCKLVTYTYNQSVQIKSLTSKGFSYLSELAEKQAPHANN